MIYAVQGFVEEKLGPRYIENKSVPFPESFQVATNHRTANRQQKLPGRSVGMVHINMSLVNLKSFC